MSDKVIKDEDQKMFYIQIDGERALLKYRMKSDDTIEYFSTFVPEEYRGGPYAEELVSYGLEYARENNLKVIPTCPYVERHLEKNKKEYKDILIEE